MPKINIKSRNNWLSPSGLIDFNASRLNQYVLDTSDVVFNSANITTNLTVQKNSLIKGDLVVNGDLTVSGNATIINTNITTIKDNIVLLNSAEQGAGVTQGLSGVEVDRGSLINFQDVFQESTQLFKIGQIGNLQAVATREDSPLAYGAMVYNSVLGRLDSTKIFTLPMSFTSGNQSTGSSTGSVLVTGGIGVTGNICSDGYIAIKGSDYSNYIKSDINNNFTINSGNDIIFQVSSNKNIKIPTNVNILLGSNITAVTNGTDFNLSNTIGNINLSTINNGLFNLPLNTYLSWGNTNNSIRYDSSNIVLNSTGNFIINTILNVNNATSSSSSTSGSIITTGGIASSNTTDSVNSSNGGSGTFSGGLAIAKTTYIGKTLLVGDTTININQVSGQGVNIRSINRTLTTISNTDVTFNSFEGGNINSSTSNITNASTLYIANAPTISGGGNITNSYALFIANGAVNLGGSLIITSTTPSTSYTSGAFTLKGGISINNTTNALSITNGGSFSTAGGIAVGLDAYFGGQMNIGISNITQTQIAQQGINFRSYSRTITTTNGSDLVFNSFEGGIINATTNINNSSTIYIKSAPTISGALLSNSYSLWIASGTIRFDTNLIITNSISSTSNSTGSIVTSGGIASSNTTDATSPINGGSMTLAGGLAIGKTVYSNFGYYSNNGIGNHIVLQNGNLNRFGFSLSGTETGSNIGSNLLLNSYTDLGISLNTIFNITRSGIITIGGTTASTSNSIGQVLLTGGISISNSTNSTNYTNGGSLTSSGGFAFSKDGYINGTLNVNTNLNVNGITNLNQTNINTNNGTFSVTGNNNFSLISSSSSLLRTTTGNITLESTAQQTYINGYLGITLASTNSGITLNANGTSNFTTTSGVLTLSGIGINVNGNSGTINVQNTSGINIITTDSVNGVKIATTSSGIPVSIGDTLSTTTINGSAVIQGNLTVNGTTATVNSTIVSIKDIAFVVNNGPTGISDGGMLVHRYQTPNNTGLGQVVSDTAKVTSTFGIGSSLPNTLVLNSTASSIDNYYQGWWIKTQDNQVRRILSYTGSTKTALLYATGNTSDGLDLVTAPTLGQTYQLYDVPYAGIYYSASAREFRFSGVPFDQGSGTFGTPTTNLNIHCNYVITDSGFTANGDSTISSTTTTAFKVASSTGNTLTVDSVNGNVLIANPVNTVNSSTSILFQQLDSTSTVQTYSSIYSQIISNLSLTSNLLLNTKVSGVLTNFISLTGSTNTVDISRITNFFNTTASTSSSIGSVIFSGGISINNSTDAINTINGGSITTSGGLAVNKKIYIGGGIYSTKTNSTLSTNTFTGTEANTNINGDLILYNSTSQTIYFNNNGSALPSFTTRSLGTKIVLYPNITASTVDYALGINGTSLWSSSSGSFDWYINTTSVVKIDNNGITTNSIRFLNGTNYSNIYISTNNTRLIPNNILGKFNFRNALDSLDTVTIDNYGLLNLAVSPVINIVANTGNILNINSSTFTDNNTVSTLTIFITNYFGQTTLNATNTSITTTKAINTFISGSPIQGTNETFTNAYSLYIDNSTSSGTVTNGYSFYVAGGLTGTITNSYAMYIDGTNKSYFNSNVIIGSVSIVTDTTNTITTGNGALNISGDLVMYSVSSRQSLFFSTSASGIPATTTRSAGSRLVLLPNTTAGTVDYALGISTSSMWYSVGDNTCNHSWYLGNSLRMQLDNTGIIFTGNSATTLPIQKISNNTSGLTLVGGSAIGSTNGSQIDLYGTTNASFPGLLNLSSGTSGSIKMNTNNILALTINSSQNLVLSSTTDSTGANDGSIYTPGGIQVSKKVYVGTGLIMNFNQPYTFTGDSSGRLNIQAGSSGVVSKQRLFSANNLSNTIEIYGLGNTSSLVNTEFLSVGFISTSNNYQITTNVLGTGLSRSLVLQTSGNTNQLSLNTDGSVTVTTGTLNTQKISITDTTDAGTGSGSIVTLGGGYITKNLIVGSNLTVNGTISGGVSTTQSITISSIVNSGAVTPVNIKTITNTNEVLMTCAFTFTPTAINTKTSFILTIPLVTTNFVNVYDVIFSLSGFYNDGLGNFIDINNLRCYPITGTTTANLIFTSGNISSVVHTIMVTARYTKG